VTPPPSSARLTFQSWTDEDTALAEALWCDPEVTHYFGGATTREQARARLDRERENSLGIQYWPMFLRDTGEFAGCAGLRTLADGSKDDRGGRPPHAICLGAAAGRGVFARSPRIWIRHDEADEDRRRAWIRARRRSCSSAWVFGYTHNTMWGTKAIEVRMYAMDVEMWRLIGGRPVTGNPSEEKQR
jgi:hypothetical protein